MDTEQKQKGTLKIHEINLTDFKSYYGNHTIGPFHEQFTAVIGPNGSGKSNLIESLLFVFGKKAKSLRANQLQNLIHSSLSHQNIREASVEVVFNHTKPSGGIGKISLKRVVYHTSVSKYYLNDHEVALDTVMTFFKERGLNIKHSRFLVLQGEVEEIFSMKPKSGSRESPGLLEFLEGTVGTAEFRDEMEETDEKLTRLDDRRIEDGERSRLARSAVEQIYPLVRNYVVGLANRIFQMTFNNLVLQVRVLGITQSLDEYSRMINSKEESILSIQRNTEAMRNGIEQLNEKLKEFNSKKYKRIQKQQDNNQQLSLLGDQNSTINGQLHEAQDMLISLKKRQVQLDKEVTQRNSELQQKKDFLPSLTEKLNQLQVQRQNMEEDLAIQTAAIQEKTSELYRKKKELENNIYPYERTKMDLENEVEQLQHRLKTIKKDDERRLLEQSDLTLKNSQSESQVGEIQLIVAKFQDILSKIEQQKIIMIQRLTTKEHEAENIKKKISSLEEIIAQNLQSNEEQSARYKLIYEIKRASQKGLIPTICGRLGDLATIDSRYDVAITVACPQLDHIVVHTNSDALKCIEYLKVNKLGRCTFSIVEKVPQEVHQYISREYVPPKRANRLFDLLKFKSDVFKPVFYNFLRDTLVTETLEEANVIAFSAQQVRRPRVVSMDGKLIESTGIISGGGVPRRGGMASQFKNEVSQEDLAKLKQQRLELQQVFEDLQEETKMLEQKLNEIQRDEQESRIRYKKNVVDLEMLRDQIKENTARLEQVTIMLGNMEQKKITIKQIEADLRDKKEKIFDLDTKMEQDRFQIRMIEIQVRKVAGDLYDDAKEQTRSIIQMHEKHEEELSKLKAQISGIQQKISVLEDSKEDLQQKIYNSEEDIKTQIETLKGIEERMVELVNKDQRIKKKLLILQQDMKDQEVQQSQMKQQINKQLNEIATLENERNQIKENSKKLRENQHQYQSEIKSQDEEFFTVIENFQHSGGNYLVDVFKNIPVGSDFQEEEISFENLFFKSYQRYKMKFFQQIKEQFIPNCIHLIPDKISHHLEIFEANQIESLIQYEMQLQDINQDSARNENYNFDSHILMEFIKRSREFKNTSLALEEAQKKYQELKTKYDTLRMKRKNKFSEGFSLISNKLREIYQHLSGGGDADLDLIDSLDPFSEGVSFQVRPKNKTWKSLSRLSGGEKTLSSLSLLLAIHFYKPNSFYFFDEIDAALDYKNVGIVAKYIKEQTKDTQFSIISLRNNMFEEASKLVGIYKVYDVTMILMLDPQLFQDELQEEILNNI